MKSRNGFTLVEILAIMIILGLLMVLTIPAYTSIYSGIKRNNYQNKLVELSTAAKKYGNKIKDEVKVAGDACKTIKVAELIKKGYISSDLDGEPALLNPTDQTKMEGDVKICYCENDFDIDAFYTTPFNPQVIYHVGDVVSDGNTLYECVLTTKMGISLDSKDSETNKEYFREIIC